MLDNSTEAPMLPLLFTVTSLAWAAPHADLCAALQAERLSMGAVSAALAAGAPLGEPCEVAQSYFGYDWDGPEVALAILFPPYLIGKLIFGGRTHTEMVDVMPLVLAIGRHNHALVEALVAAGAPVTPDVLRAALEDAVAWGHPDGFTPLLGRGVAPDDVLDGELVLHLLGVPGAWEALVAAGAHIDAGEGSTALQLAAAEGSRDQVARLLTLGASPDGHWGAGQHPLVSAAEHGDLPLAQTLVAAGVDLGKVGAEALGAAASRGDLAMVTWLDQAHVDVNTRWGGDPPLALAVSSGNAALVRYLLDRGADVQAEADFQATALHLAARVGRADLVQLLLSAGARPDALAVFSETPMEGAILSGSVDCVRLLIAAGASLDLPGKSALRLAAGTGRREMVQALLDLGLDLNQADPEGYTALDAAVLSENADMARLLISLGAPVGVSGAHTHTVLHAAAASGHEEAVLLALKLGVPVDAVDEAGRTPAMLAVAECEPDNFQILFARKAKVTATDARGRGMLHYGADCGLDSTISALFALHVPVDQVDKQGRSALQYAAIEHTTALDPLLKNGILADPPYQLTVDQKGGYGRTALHAAAEAGETWSVEVLLQRHAAIDPLDEAGQTPLFRAVVAGQRYTAEKLLAAGARADVVDAEGLTALDVAVAHRDSALVSDLLSAPHRVPAAPYVLDGEDTYLVALLLGHGLPVEVEGGVLGGIENRRWDLVDLLLAHQWPAGLPELHAALLAEHVDVAQTIADRLPLDDDALKALQRILREENASRYVRRWLRDYRKERRRAPPDP